MHTYPGEQEISEDEGGGSPIYTREHGNRAGGEGLENARLPLKRGEQEKGGGD